MLSRTVPLEVGEGRIAAELATIQAGFPGVMIGSYPKITERGYATDIVLRCRDEGPLAEATAAVARLAAGLATSD